MRLCRPWKGMAHGRSGVAPAGPSAPPVAAVTEVPAGSRATGRSMSVPAGSSNPWGIAWRLHTNILRSDQIVVKKHWLAVASVALSCLLGPLTALPAWAQTQSGTNLNLTVGNLVVTFQNQNIKSGSIASSANGYD